MSIPRQAGPVLAAVIISAALYGSIVAMTPQSYEITYGAEAGPTPWSADSSRIKSKPADEEAAPSF